MRRWGAVVAGLAVLAVAAGMLVVGVRGEGRSEASDEGRDAPFFGIDVPRADPDHVGRLGRQLGCGPTVMNRFVKFDSDFGPAQLASLAEGGRTPMISLEPWSWRMRSGDTDEAAYSLAATARGDHDVALRSLATTLAGHHGPVLLRFAHEMNADWYPWGVVVNGGSPAAYVRAWRHVHAVVSAIAPDVEWVWSPVAAWWPGALPLHSVYPGDDVVDFVAASGYGHSGTAEQTFGRWYAEVRTFSDKPALLSETGADGSAKERWIASLAPFLRARPAIRGFVWFDSSPQTTGATGDYRIDDEPAHLRAFASMLRQVGVRCLPDGS